MQNTFITEQALIPQILSKNGNRIAHNVLAVVAGTLLLSLLAQLAIPLPWTPVPITGQTFGVALTSLLWGRKHGLAIMLSYLSIGALGLPVFAMGSSGLSVGPTVGYLVGMTVASVWMGTLADLGWTKSFLRCWLTAASGSIFTFSFGVLGLSFFVTDKNLFVIGVLPFLAGDFIKNLLASSIAYQAQKRIQ